MHALLEAQELRGLTPGPRPLPRARRPGSSRPAGGLAAAALTVGLLLEAAGGGTAASAPPGSRRSLPLPGEAPRAAAAAPSREGARPAAPAAPSGGSESAPAVAPAVALPPAGTYLAPRILRLARELLGLSVHVAERRLNRVLVTVPGDLGSRRASLEELERLLARHSLHLHLWDHPRRGPLVVASGSQEWSPPLPTLTRTFRVRHGDFDSIRSALEKEVELLNRGRPEAAGRVALGAAPRVGKIFASAPSRALLGRIKRLFERLDQEDPRRPRLESYAARFVRADLLGRAVLEDLTPAERERVRVTVAGAGNQLLYRARPELAGKLRKLLERLDSPLATRRARTPGR